MNRKEKAVSMIPLVNFDCDEDVVELDADLRLRRMAQGELSNLIGRVSGYRLPLKKALRDTIFVIERELFGDWTDCGEFSPYVRNIILALRLLKAETVVAPTAFREYSDGTFGVSDATPLVRVHPGFDTQYFLKKEEIPSFKGLYDRLRNLKEEKPYLVFPLAQYAKSFEETFPEDIIVDIMVAFEALIFYKFEKTPDQAGVLMGIAVGMLLGSTQKEREEIKSILREVHGLRNAIVHGNVDKFERLANKRNSSVLLKAVDYLRMTLTKLLEE
jgi:hypothetical protein